MLALRRCDGADLTEREEHFGTLHNVRSALFIEERDERFACSEFHNGILGLEVRIGAERIGCGFHVLLFLGGEGSERVLNPVTQLSEHRIGNICGVLRHEIDAHALASDETDNLLNLIHQALWRVREERVSLVEEEYQTRQFLVAHLGQTGIEVREEPKQEGGIEFRLVHQFVGSQDIHHTFAVSADLQEVHDVESRLAEELVSTLILECEEGTLDGSHACRRDVAVAFRQFACVVGNVGQHRTQVLEVEQEQTTFVSHFEENRHHASLHLVQLHESRHQVGPHVRDGGAHRVTLFTKDVVEANGSPVELRILDAELSTALLDERGHRARLRDAREVALHIGHEARHPSLAERLSQHLQCHSLTRTSSTGNQPMTVRHLTIDANRPILSVSHI